MPAERTSTMEPLPGHQSMRTKIQYDPLSTTGSSHNLFHYAPLSTSSSSSCQESQRATKSVSTSSFPTTESPHTIESSFPPKHISGPVSITPSSELSTWFETSVLMWVFGLLIAAMLLFIAQSWHRKAAARRWEEELHPQREADEFVRSPTTALEEQNEMQELRKRRVKNGEKVVVGNLGSESRPARRYARSEADVEAHTPWKRTVCRTEVVGLGIQFDEPSPRPSFVPSSIGTTLAPRAQAVEEDGEDSPIGCLGRAMEVCTGFLAKKWGSSVEDGAEDRLVFGVKDEERESGEKGRAWMISNLDG